MKEAVQSDDEFYVPNVIDSLTTKRVLTSELCNGTPLEHLLQHDQDTRNKVTLI